MNTPLKTQWEIVLKSGNVSKSTTVYTGPGYPECPKAKAEREKPVEMYLTPHGLMDVAEAAKYFASIAEKAFAIPEKHFAEKPTVNAAYNPAYKDAPIKVQTWDGAVPYNDCSWPDPHGRLAEPEPNPDEMDFPA